jgi:hypothetical protein
MNPEKKFKLIMLLVIIASLVFAVFLWLYIKNFFYPFLILIFFEVFLFVLIEFYIRIQHNIDAKYIKLSKIREDLDEGIFLIKQDIDFKLINQKHEIKDMAKDNLAQMKESCLLSEKRINEKMDNFFWTYIKDKREEYLMKIAPDIFKYKSVLYIGARPSRADFLEAFRKEGYEIDILEIYQPNAEHFKKIQWINKVIEGDVSEVKLKKKYDIIFWWHGPEHIKEDKLKGTLKKLESASKKLVVLGCPWGKIEQNEIFENENERHLSYFDTGYFEELGYKTAYFGRKDFSGSNISAVKAVKK